jgi:hypothetical protein
MKSGGAFYQTTRMSLSYLKFAVESEGKGGKHMERFELATYLLAADFIKLSEHHSVI